ncbi:Peroxisomal membrane signal receptor PTS1 [Apophysomyces sp. BC1015]|nr:Peroxisomal membrane signal receptor PTS1 [Apophysomyces sp. BC1015]
MQTQGFDPGQWIDHWRDPWILLWSKPDQVIQLTDEFMQEDRVIDRPPGVFEFNGLSRELDSIKGKGPMQHGDWAADFLQQSPMHHPPPDGQFEEFEKIYQQNQMPAQGHNWHEEFATFQANHPAMTEGEREAFERAFDEAKQGAQVDWEKEFAAQDSWASEFAEQEGITNDNEALAKTAAMLLDSVDVESNPKFKNSNFMNLMRKLRDSEVSIEGNKMVDTKQGQWASEFQQQNPQKSWTDDFMKHAGGNNGGMWSDEFAVKAERGWTQEFETRAAQEPGNDWASEYANKQPEQLFNKGTEMNDWVQQYHKNIAHLKDAKDAEWDDMQKDWDRFKPEHGLGYRAVNPEYDTYTFTTNNPYLMNPAAIDNTEHASLADSILALEAKAQLQTSDPIAWQELGFKQQENERDAAAIAAFRRAVSINPALLDGWLALAVSYTNENCRADAYDCLEQWIANNDKYKHLVRSDRGNMNAEARHAYLTDMFLEAARSSPGAEMDANVQVGLGVLFNVSEEFHKAIDCFKSALQSRPQDYLLWNKLGATLANSRDTPGAIEAYFNALEINPSYVRARYNLAISCINLSQHREAAEHLLTALALQQAGDSNPSSSVMIDQSGNQVSFPNGMSDNVWDSLRMLMFMMNREDLAEQCNVRNLSAFRGVFDF